MIPTDHREPVASLLHELTPDIDAAALLLLVARYEALAQRVSECIATVDNEVRALTEALDGQTSVAAEAKGRLLGRELHAARDKVMVTADIVLAYADAVEQAKQRLTVVAAIADRDVLAGAVLAAATGEVATQAGAERLAARTMSAAAAELDHRTALIARDAEQSVPEQGQHPGGMPMTPGAMMAPLGALAGIAAARTASGGEGSAHVPDVDLGMLRARAAVLTATQPPEVAPWIRVAVGLGIDQAGRRTVVVGTSEPCGYLRPGVVPEPHEVVVGDGRAPELAFIGYCHDRELTPLAVCAATPPSPEVAAAIDESGAHAIDPGGHEDPSGPGL
ncbi:hypothetical protein DFR67_114134 [Williamsia limnetica]|uniref:Uncharacterized protein n=1 Tax=Williamsia limnetica TaxID=882452 RepID=A0A318RJS5_WILLI|nr:hypothetical protein [Williamsia limnetica]PYE14035.1 hypothetical protein DFR67_114134 [Williamsia limnetica]